MTIEEFELKIEAQTESPNLDYKADMAWDVKSFAKDIIAMSNQRDPGYIIIGVREQGIGYLREGVSHSNRESYKIDTMKDQLMSFTDPAVDIQVFFFVDKEDKDYVVIKVAPFKDVPILSRKGIVGDKPNTFKLIPNTLYYRNTNKCIESAPISNSTDFRELIEIAAIKLMQKRKALGYHISQASDKQFEDELKDIPSDGVLAKIKSQGYWEITFRPNQPEHLESVKQCEEIIRKATVRLGGWELPFIPSPTSEVGGGFTGHNFFEVWTDFGLRKEFLRMYKSGQIKIFRALIEDWYAGDAFRSQLALEVAPGTVVNILYSVTYLITEVFEFLSRLSINGLYKEGVAVTLTLHNAKNRKLRVDDSRRNPLAYDRVTMSPHISISKDFTNMQILSEHITIATSIILEVMDAFGFRPDRGAVLNDQRNFIDGKA